jgi:hypothetical protein
VRLELVPLTGEVIALPVDRARCEGHLVRAGALLRQINRIINLQRDMPETAAAQLAQPSPENCRGCPFRPACHHYWQARAQGGKGWSSDAAGTFARMQKLRNGRLAVVLDPERAGCGITVAKGISPDADRHPALARVEPGARISVFNLRHSGDAAGEETPATAIYWHPG